MQYFSEELVADLERVLLAFQAAIVSQQAADANEAAQVAAGAAAQPAADVPTPPAA